MTSNPAKRLTYIVNYVSADDAQHFVHIPNLLSHLEQLRWTVDLLSERGGTGRSEVLGRDVTFLSSHNKLIRIGRLVASLLAARRRGGRLVFVRISKFAAFVSAVLGRVLGWKTVYWLSGTVEDFNVRSGIRGRVGVLGMWLLLRLVDRLATGPETMVTYYSRRYDLSERKIMLLYNDIAIDRLIPFEAEDEIYRIRALLVHRLSPVRETSRYMSALLESLAAHGVMVGVPVVLDICGDGPERAELEAIAQAASPAVDVQFHGSVPQRELARFYRRATIFIMPSFREGFPRVMLEAMAHGLPIVATNAGGTADLCGPLQQAYIVDRIDSAAFGRAVARLLASPHDRRELSEENLHSVRRFATPEVSRMYDRALSELINAQPST